jgi:predicted metal-binding membrane protein
MEALRGRVDRTGFGQLPLIALLLGVSALAWVVTDDRMAGMDHGPGSHLGSLAFFAGVWVVMMAAMMFPSITPMVGSYRQAQARLAATALFVAGYLLAWTAFGIAAYALISLVESLEFGILAWDSGGRWLTVGVVAAAAIYQLTPAKDACLTRCRDALGFVRERWRDGSAGALRMGMEHGAWCVGCCWALMATLFAVGVMSLSWMAFVTALIAVEKLLPWKALANRGVAAILFALALGLAVDPGSVPALTEPGGHEMHPGGHEMHMMGG